MHSPGSGLSPAGKRLGTLNSFTSILLSPDTSHKGRVRTPSLANLHLMYMGNFYFSAQLGLQQCNRADIISLPLLMIIFYDSLYSKANKKRKPTVTALVAKMKPPPPHASTLLHHPVFNHMTAWLIFAFGSQTFCFSLLQCSELCCCLLVIGIAANVSGICLK